MTTDGNIKGISKIFLPIQALPKIIFLHVVANLWNICTYYV